MLDQRRRRCTAPTLGQRCIGAVHMFCVCWVSGLWPVRSACIRLNRVWFYVCYITVLPLWSVYPYVVSVLTRAIFRGSFPFYGDVERGSTHLPCMCVEPLSVSVCGSKSVRIKSRTNCVHVYYRSIYDRQALGIEPMLVQWWAASYRWPASIDPALV